MFQVLRGCVEKRYWLDLSMKKRLNSMLGALFGAESGKILSGKWGGVGEVARQGVLGKALENQMGRTALGRDRMPGSMECTCGVAGCVAPAWADWVWVRTGSSSLVSVKPCLSGIDLLMCASCVFSRI